MCGVKRSLHLQIADGGDKPTLRELFEQVVQQLVSHTHIQYIHIWLMSMHPSPTGGCLCSSVQECLLSWGNSSSQVTKLTIVCIIISNAICIRNGSPLLIGIKSDKHGLADNIDVLYTSPFRSPLVNQFGLHQGKPL